MSFICVVALREQTLDVTTQTNEVLERGACELVGRVEHDVGRRAFLPIVER